MAAFNAARQTAIAEISKVLNNPNGSAAVSDSARHEVDGLIGPNATLKQIYAAANVLKQDMKNRHDSYAQQIDAINKRIGGDKSEKDRTQTTQAAPPLPARLSASDVGKTYTNKDGKAIKVTAVNPKDPTQFRFDQAAN